MLGEAEGLARANVANVIEAFNSHVAASMTLTQPAERQAHDQSIQL